MNTTPSDICQNCNTKNELPFKYCPNCGQKNTDSKTSFSELWSEFQNAVLNIESRTWRTFKDLFIPGKLTSEYFHGKRRRYVHPLRLLLVTSILLIIAMSFQDFQSYTNHTYNIKEQILKNYERQRLYRILGNITDSTNAIFSEQTEPITDTILAKFKDSLISLLPTYGDGYSDSIDLNQYVSVDGKTSEKISKYDFLNKDKDELVEIYKKNAGSFERLVFKQKVKYIQDESKLTAAMIGHTSWATLLMMPCLALVLYFLNIRHDYYYIEHLILTFHLHAFSFLMFAILIIGLNVFPLWVFYTFGVIILTYVFISMWKVYRQSLAKTLIKFLVLIIAYGGLFISFLLGTILFTFILL